MCIRDRILLYHLTFVMRFVHLPFINLPDSFFSSRSINVLISYYFIGLRVFFSLVKSINLDEFVCVSKRYMTTFQFSSLVYGLQHFHLLFRSIWRLVNKNVINSAFASFLLAFWFCIYTHVQMRILKQDSVYLKSELTINESPLTSKESRNIMFCDTEKGEFDFSLCLVLSTFTRRCASLNAVAKSRKWLKKWRA